MQKPNSQPPNAAPGACLAVLGTGSDVGKSVIACALCRIFSDLGLSVAPFKAQNMSNNSGVTPEGLEMGRAQIVQAEAARIPPHTDMNPVLLKPVSNVGSQVIVNGRPWMDAAARDYYARRDELFGVARAALARLRAGRDLVVMEGAGSCAEVNLMAHDIVNLRMARAAGAPVILVADIDRGGVFAQIVGTLACLEPEDRDLIAGFVINRFRGDLSLFADGARWIAERTGKPVFGVLPWFTDFRIDAEDSVTLERPDADRPPRPGEALIGVIRLPHISNFTDFDPLAEIPGCRPRYLGEARDLRDFAAIILPGSKNTRGDLAWLEKSGWAEGLAAYRAAGGHILGICGGYQMLGESVEDPEGFEGEPGASRGLGLLPIRTVLRSPKTTTRARFRWGEARGEGYEIHMGVTTVPEGASLLRVESRNGEAVHDLDGCASPDGRVLGCYLHGLFDNPDCVRRWLAGLGLGHLAVPEQSGAARRDAAYEALAAHALAHLDIRAVAALLPESLRERVRERLP